jgi:hypothetical protein
LERDFNPTKFTDGFIEKEYFLQISNRVAPILWLPNKVEVTQEEPIQVFGHLNIQPVDEV